MVVKGLIDAGQVSELLADYDRALRGEIEVPAFGDRRVKGAMVQLANPSQHMAHWRGHAYFRRALLGGPAVDRCRTRRTSTINSS